MKHGIISRHKYKKLDVARKLAVANVYVLFFHY